MSEPVLELLRGLVLSIVGEDCREGDVILAPDESEVELLQAVGAPSSAPSIVWSAEALPPAGRVFAYFTDTTVPHECWWLQALASQGRLALLAWPRDISARLDREALGLVRSLGLEPLMPASVDVATPQDMVYVGMATMLNAPPESSTISGADFVASDREWADAAQAYLALGLRDAAAAAARRAGTAGDEVLRRLAQQAMLDSALASGLTAVASPLLPVLASIGPNPPREPAHLPLVRSAVQDFRTARFAQMLDDEVIGPGVDPTLCDFVLACSTPTSHVLDLAPEHGHLALALAHRLAAGDRITAVENNTARHEALAQVARLLGPVGPRVHASWEAALDSMPAEGRLVIHVTLPVIAAGVIPPLVARLRTRAGDFAIIVSGLTMAIADQDPVVRATIATANAATLVVRGVVRDGATFTARNLSEMPRPQLLFVC